MKKTIEDKFWIQEQSDKSMNVGFTQSFINQILCECFHVVQADVKTLIEGQPMLVYETNDGIESLASPVTGTVMYFNARARNFPDRLTEEEVILTILPKGIVLPAKVKEKPAEIPQQAAGGWVINDHINDLMNLAQANPPRPRGR